MGNKSFDELMNGYINNQLNDDELNNLLHLMHQQNYQDNLKGFIEQLLADQSVSGLSDQKRADIIFQNVMNAAAKQGEFQEEPVIHLRQRPKHSALVWMIAAASVLFAVWMGYIFFAPHKAETPVAQNAEKKLDSVTYALRHEVNTTGKEKRVQLPDGSLIVLANKSEITYREPFLNKRDITLIGKAFFKVTKDKTKPFTVYSGAISTTALGTEFTVTSIQNTNQIIVRLYEGKVVVKAVDKANNKLKKDIYLLPGQAYVYGTATAHVKNFKLANTDAPEQVIKQEQPLDNPSFPENEENTYFMFNNQPLNEVFDGLAGLYNVKISYDKKDVQNLYFIGKYNNTVPLETILKRIGTLNNLTVTKREDGYIISK